MQKIIELFPQIGTALGQTFVMMFFTLTIAALFGIPLGTYLYLIRPGSIMEKPKIYLVLDIIVNIVRSFPFLILLVAIIPLTRLIVGSSIGTAAVIVPLSICAIPDFARLTEQTLLEIPHGVVEMAEAAGANTLQIIWKVLYKEARSGLVNNATMISVSFFSYSTVAGLVGGGGIGDFAIKYGYYRYRPSIMLFTVILIIIIVQIIQTAGRIISHKIDKRN
ncbi:MAG: ABC transporter permease [Spirochaetaceae bacterium]|jgi:D-methionine transport system permease protein|nr:ABC transporter permease [Spirochaetaceae bacterium]